MNSTKKKLYYRKQDLLFRLILVGIGLLIYVPWSWALYYLYNYDPDIQGLFTIHYPISVICAILLTIGFFAEKFIDKKYLHYGLYTSGAFIGIALILKEMVQEVFSKEIYTHIGLISGLMFINFYIIGCCKLTYDIIQYLKAAKQYKLATLKEKKMIKK